MENTAEKESWGAGIRTSVLTFKFKGDLIHVTIEKFIKAGAQSLVLEHFGLLVFNAL